MVEIDTRRLSKLVPLLDEVSEAERRSSLPEWVEGGEISLYVRVPVGRTVYMESGLRPLPASFTNVYDAGKQPLSPHDAAEARDAERAGTPVIRYPMIVRGAAYLGLAAKDARLLLELERMDVHWFPHAIQFSPKSATDAKHFTQLIPRRSPCCLRPDDGQLRPGPWIGHDAEHALAITLSDVFIEPAAVKAAFRAKVDPLDLRDTSPGAYVLYRAAVHFYDPAKGVEASQAVVQEWVKKEAKACEVDDWLFNAEVLKQVRKLINTQHNERQGVKSPTDLDLTVLDSNEARILDQLHWASERLMLVVHAARCWQQLVSDQQRPWEAIDPSEQMRMTRTLGKRLGDWGFSGSGEHSAVLSVAIYPVDVRKIRLQQKAKRNMRS